MSLLKEIWNTQIAENLYPENTFLNYATDHSAYISGNKVHIPQAGAAPAVTKNPSSFPLTAVQRGDQDFTYTIDGYATDPLFVSDITAIQLSYPKMQSLTYNTVKTLEKTIGDNTLYNWA